MTSGHRTHCCSALRSIETQSRGERVLATPCWSLTHPALCPGGCPLRTGPLRILGFQVHLANRGHWEEGRGQEERGAGVFIPHPASTPCCGQWLGLTVPAASSGQALAPPALGAITGPHSQALGASRPLWSLHPAHTSAHHPHIRVTSSEPSGGLCFPARSLTEMKRDGSRSPNITGSGLGKKL